MELRQGRFGVDIAGLVGMECEGDIAERVPSGLGRHVVYRVVRC